MQHGLRPPLRPPNCPPPPPARTTSAGLAAAGTESLTSWLCQNDCGSSLATRAAVPPEGPRAKHVSSCRRATHRCHPASASVAGGGDARGGGGLRGRRRVAAAGRSGLAD